MEFCVIIEDFPGKVCLQLLFRNINLTLLARGEQNPKTDIQHLSSCVRYHIHDIIYEVMGIFAFVVFIHLVRILVFI